MSETSRNRSAAHWSAARASSLDCVSSSVCSTSWAARRALAICASAKGLRSAASAVRPDSTVSCSPGVTKPVVTESSMTGLTAKRGKTKMTKSSKTRPTLIAIHVRCCELSLTVPAARLLADGGSKVAARNLSLLLSVMTAPDSPIWTADSDQREGQLAGLLGVRPFLRHKYRSKSHATGCIGHRWYPIAVRCGPLDQSLVA